VTLTDHRLSALLQRLNDSVHWAKRYRNALLAPFALLFAAGLWYSFKQLDINAGSLALLPALLLFFVFAPMGILYGALGLKLLAQVTGSSIRLRDAWNHEGYAQLADALPVPGGPLVRTAALMRSGVGSGKSVILVTATGVMWVAIAAIGAGLSLFDKAPVAASVLLVTGAVAFVPILGWIVLEAGIRVAGMLLMHRLVGLVLVSVRMILSFAIIGQLVSVEQATLFSFANIAGSAVVVAPAGLGVSEAIGSALSELVDVDPAVAFLAIAIGRIVGLFSTYCVVMSNSLLERVHENRPVRENFP
jgi:hypothetical protein